MDKLEIEKIESKVKEEVEQAVEFAKNSPYPAPEEALEDIAYEDEDTEVQKRAVYALEDLPDGRGIPYLIKIAKVHPKLVIRKKAIYCLGDSGDQRALKALIDILQKK